MKGNKRMLFMLILFIVLVVIYMGLNLWNKNSEEREAKKAEEEKIHVINDDNLTAIRYTDGSSTMSFIKEDDIWYYEEDKEIPLAQETVENVADTITELTAVRELDNPDELEDYGLTDPAYILWYTSENVEVKIRIGDMTGDNYYLTVEDSGKVYTVTDSLVYAMVFDLSEFVEDDDVPTIGSGNLKRVEVTENGEKIAYTDEDDLAQLAGGFGVLELEDCVNYHITDKKLADYGLDEKNRVTAVATYSDPDTEEKKKFTVYIGDTTGDGNQYIMVEGSKLVYQVSKDVVENMIVVSEEEKGEDSKSQ